MRFQAMHVRFPDGGSGWYVVDGLIRKISRLSLTRWVAQWGAANLNASHNEHPIRDRAEQVRLLRRAR